MRKRIAAAAAAGSLLAGGAAGAALFGPGSAGAQTTTTTQPPAAEGRAHGPGGGHHEAVDDLSVAASAIGIPQADLTTALRSGQSLAQVAKAHNVDPQKVIDALVADEHTELADAVKAGTITQAQADQKKAGIVQRITDRVNNVRPAGGPGKGASGRRPAR